MNESTLLRESSKAHSGNAGAKMKVLLLHYLEGHLIVKGQNWVPRYVVGIEGNFGDP